MLKEEVTDEDIAEGGKWTNIPVSKMLEQEAEKLAHAEQILGNASLAKKKQSPWLLIPCTQSC